jgi:hypothetical protein
MHSSIKLLAMVALAACSSSNAAEKASTPAGPTPAATAPGRPSRDLITRAQIDATPSQDAFELVQRLRPEYLRERGQSSITRGPALPVVYMDGVRRGGPEMLKTIRSSEIEEIRFISATDATTRWGTEHTAGAIEIKMRHGR